LKHLKSITAVYAVEVYKPYVWESKFNIINYYLQNPDEKKVSIHLFHENIFDFDFIGLGRQLENKEFLIVGNPPWVTNSTLSGLNSQNLPVKVNIKNHNGLDAITGKGNFDISEYISLKMLEYFSDKNGVMAFLIKNSVIRNIIRDLNRNKFKIGSLEKLNIDAKKEFNAFVDAALMRIDLVKIAENVSSDDIVKAADSSVSIFRDEVTEKTWERYIKMLTAVQAEDAPVQRSLF